MSFMVTGPVLSLSPTYCGTIFQIIGDFRGKSADSQSSKIFFADSSGLSRDINPDLFTLPPGAYSKKRHSAFFAPSKGSK